MKFVYSLVIAASLAAAVLAQSPAKILKEAEKALGGSKALKSIRSVSKTGSLTRLGDGERGNFVFESTRPNLMHTRYDVGGFETETAFNGRSGWTRDSRSGLSTLTGKSSGDLQAAALYLNNLWLNYKDEKSKITPGGQTTIDGKTANAVVLTTQKGVVLRLFFDGSTGLPLRDEVTIGDELWVQDHADYRSVNGVKFPFLTRLTTNGESYDIQIDRVVVNQPIGRSAFDFPKAKGEIPDIPVLLKEVQANQDRVEAMLDRYSYTQKSISRELGKDGTLRETESETHQLSFYKGYRTRRLIEKNGKPLSAKEQANVDRDIAEQVEDIEKKIAKDEARTLKQGSTGAPAEDSRRVSIAEVLRASKLLNPRRERFQGRDVIVFDFEPDPGFDMKNAKSMLKFFGRTAGVIWIDERDKQIARVEAVLAESLKFGGGVLAKLRKGASFTLEQERVNDEIWLPSRTDIHLSARVLLFKGIDINRLVRSYDYRRFETEVKDAKIDGTKPPENF